MRNPFRKQKNQTIAELESYYASQRTGRRTGVAWVMAIISLLITLIVIALLYFGIRWIYRTATSDDSAPVSTTQNETNVTSSDEAGSGDEQTGSDALTSLLTGNDSDSESEEGTITDEAPSTTRDVASTTDSATVSNSSNTATTPSTGGSELPNTGAGESLALLFVTVVLFGYFTARKRQLK